MEFGTKLKTLRVGMNLTQQQLATRLGVAKSVVSYYESGDRFPSYDVLIKIARTFHTTTDFLLGLERERVIDVSGLSEHEVSAIANLVDIVRDKK